MFAPEKSAARMVLAVGMALGGCTPTELVQDGLPPPMADLSQPNYQRIVAANIKKMFPNPPDADLEISGLRPVDHIKGPAWLTCLRSIRAETRSNMPFSFRTTPLLTGGPLS
jgi:hypothetical protein